MLEHLAEQDSVVSFVWVRPGKVLYIKIVDEYGEVWLAIAGWQCPRGLRISDPNIVASRVGITLQSNKSRSQMMECGAELKNLVARSSMWQEFQGFNVPFQMGLKIGLFIGVRW